MALARVVSFEGVSKDRMDEMNREIQQGERPADIPASEIVVLHDPEGEKSLVVLFFENEDDYKRGDKALNAMSASETPGRRTSVTKYEVAFRMTAHPSPTWRTRECLPSDTTSTSVAAKARVRSWRWPATAAIRSRAASIHPCR